MPTKKTFAQYTYKVYAPADLKKRWFVYYYDEKGKRIRSGEGINEHQTATDRMAAAQALIQKLQREHAGIIVASATQKNILQYLSDNKARWTKTTYKGYQAAANHFIDFCAGKEASPKLVQDYFAQLAKDLHPTTYNSRLTFLGGVFRKIGALDFCASIVRLKTEKTPARYFQRYQVKQLIEHIGAADPDLKLFVEFMFYTFIRPKELRSLRAGDILMDDAEIRVRAEISKNKKTQFVAIPDVFLPRLSFVYDLAPGAHIFTNLATGKPWSKNAMYERHKRFLEELGYGEGYTLYSWKHTGAVMLAKAGVSIKEIQLQMRHHSIDQTDQYLRQMGIRDVQLLRSSFPSMI